jgi:hypothetical protein
MGRWKTLVPLLVAEAALRHSRGRSSAKIRELMPRNWANVAQVVAPDNPTVLT